MVREDNMPRFAVLAAISLAALVAGSSVAPAPVPVRLAYNYCTLSYTFAYYGEKEWTDEIDRLAKAGYNTALVTDGTFKVWELTLRELGFAQSDIFAFIPDECARAWWLMGNLEGEGGPLDQATVDADGERGRFIASKMRERGIEPVLQGFYGMVPTWLARCDPDLHIVAQGKWCGCYERPAILDPASDAFARFAAVWYRNLEKVYGIKPRFLAGDLFHEGGQTGNLDVTASVRSVQSAQQAAFPGVTWVVQAWMNNPTAAVRAGLDARFTLIEALEQNMAAFDGDEAECPFDFGDLPWIWCEVLNFGGNHGLYGNLKTFARLGRAARGPGKATFRGYGALSEGFFTNPVASDLFEDMMMRPSGTELADGELAAWLDAWVDKRYGLSASNSQLSTLNSKLREAWRIIAGTAYACARNQQGAVDNLICAYPRWNAVNARTWAPKEGLYYDAALLEKALSLMEEVRADAENRVASAFKRDLYDLRRQVLSNRLRALMPRLKDDGAARKEFVALGESMSAAGECVPEEFRLSYWDALARRSGGERAVAAWHRMITTWNCPAIGHTELEDYANREYPELVRDHYLPRWKKFLPEQ